jgi:hypothetical protein
MILQAVKRRHPVGYIRMRWAGSSSFYRCSLTFSCNHLHISNGRLISLYGLNAEAGETYYFRARTIATVGSVSARDTARGASLDLDLLNSDEGEYMVAHAALSDSHAKKLRANADEAILAPP